MEGELRPGSTLVFIDEVQECPNVVTMIKFLLEREDFDYVLSGSMLGVELKCVRSLPVGYLSTVNMFPLDFEEFCWACDIAEDVLGEARDAYIERRPVDDFVNRRLLSAFHEYLMVGGMPAAVEAFSVPRICRRSARGKRRSWSGTARILPSTPATGHWSSSAYSISSPTS
ncbi:MAG: AAA family ATPase [Adlercreutzia equolifaciens]